ncbi:conserved hypothetical protein [Gammaproteobacteria bacterium]
MGGYRIFDFDGSVSSQMELMAHLGKRRHRVDLRRHRHAARLWTSPRRFEAIRREAFLGEPPFFSFLGSGDYHHFTFLLLQAQLRPLTLLLFDNHPDWTRPPHRYHCGTWIYSAARLPQVERIVIVGLESSDIDGKNFAHGDMESFHDGRIVLLPTRDVNVRLSDGTMRTLPGGGVINAILAVISSEWVYVSVDKDCLRSEDAHTNWEQGSLELSFVTTVIERLGRRVVGADTVGDWSSPWFVSPLKWIGSLLDRPRHAFALAVGAKTLARNQHANLRLLEAFDGCL